MESEVRQGSCEWPQAIRGMPGTEFEPHCPRQKEGHDKRRVLLFGYRENLKCSGEMNSAISALSAAATRRLRSETRLRAQSAKVLPRAKRLCGAKAPPPFGRMEMEIGPDERAASTPALETMLTSYPRVHIIVPIRGKLYAEAVPGNGADAPAAVRALRHPLLCRNPMGAAAERPASSANRQSVSSDRAGLWADAVLRCLGISG